MTFITSVNYIHIDVALNHIIVKAISTSIFAVSVIMLAIIILVIVMLGGIILNLIFQSVLAAQNGYFLKLLNCLTNWFCSRLYKDELDGASQRLRQDTAVAVDVVVAVDAAVAVDVVAVVGLHGLVDAIGIVVGAAGVDSVTVACVKQIPSSINQV